MVVASRLTHASRPPRHKVDSIPDALSRRIQRLTDGSALVTWNREPRLHSEAREALRKALLDKVEEGKSFSDIRDEFLVSLARREFWR